MFQGGKEGSRCGAWYLLGQDARLPGFSPGVKRHRAGGGGGRGGGRGAPRGVLGADASEFPPTIPSRLRAGVRVVLVPGSYRQRPSPAKDSSSFAKPVLLPPRAGAVLSFKSY